MPNQFSKRIKNQLKRVFRDLGDRIADLAQDMTIDQHELGCEAALLIIFTVLAYPGDYLQTAPRLSHMASKAPESLWLLLVGVLLILQTVVILFCHDRLDAPYRLQLRNRVVRCVADLVISFVFGFMGVLMLMDGPTFSGLFFSTCCVSNVCASVRVGRLIARDRECNGIRVIREYSKQVGGAITQQTG